MGVTSCVTGRYDAGICKHLLERTGALNCAQGGGLNPYIIINKDIANNRGIKWKK